MKKILSFLCCIICSTSWADSKSYRKLAEVNNCWTEQKNMDHAALPAYAYKSEKSWIALHLELVEQTLRQRRNKDLSPQQQANRNHCLDILHRYGQEGNFPINDRYADRTPIFIDPYNNFCAVGFLLKETGFEAVSRKISAETNLAYVRQLHYPELIVWANTYGFSVDELAWIQPTYPPQTSVRKVGEGVDGMVQELFVDEEAEKMYVGGSFIQADKSLTANNIAYVTESAGVYTWHSMGTGVNGKVNAIAKHDGKIFAAGSFNEAGGKTAGNIAYWNGSEWTAAGCVNGTVHDLLVFEGTLYACGAFTDCSGGSDGNFAQWNGTSWTMIPGLKGRINTMEAYGTSIVLGGDFSFGARINVVEWSATTSFTAFGNFIKNEVMDFDYFRDTLYAACKRAAETDTNELLLKLSDEFIWKQGFRTRYEAEAFGAHGSAVAFLTLCTEKTSLNIGGSFDYVAMTYAANAYNIGSYGNWSVVDSTINKMVLFKKEIYLGGLFKNGYESSEAIGERPVKGLNGIARRAKSPVSVPHELVNTVNIFPNPAQAGSLLTIKDGINAREYTLYELNGRTIGKGKLGNGDKVLLPTVAPGLYFLNLSNDTGEQLRCKLVVQ